MSGRYVSRVLESDLAAPLLLTAVAFASFADEDGHKIRPSIGRLAWMAKTSVRTVQNHATELRTLGVLELVRSPGRARPAQYRMRLEKLPHRPPYEPPDRQAGLALDEGESQAPTERVQPGAPMERVQPGAPFSGKRVQPGAPDPYVQEIPQRTHTGHPPAAPAGEGESAARLPLLPVPDPAHSAHAWCGRICVPKFLHDELKRAIGGRLALRPARLRTFYAATLEAWPAGRPIGDPPVTFWRRAFAEAHGSTRPRAVHAPRGVPRLPRIDYDSPEAIERRRRQDAAYAWQEARRAEAEARLDTMTDAERAPVQAAAERELEPYKAAMLPARYVDALRGAMIREIADSLPRQAATG